VEEPNKEREKDPQAETRTIDVKVRLADEDKERIGRIVVFADRKLARAWSRSDVLVKAFKLMAAQVASSHILIKFIEDDHSGLETLDRILRQKIRGKSIEIPGESGEHFAILCFAGYFVDLLEWIMKSYVQFRSHEALFLAGLKKLDDLCRDYQEDPKGLAWNIRAELGMPSDVTAFGDEAVLSASYSWTTIFNVWLG